MRVRLALPRGHAKKIQAHGGVRIHKHAGNPALHRGGDNAEFFVQLARQCISQGFASFDLAAGEFPIARICPSLRSAGEKYFAVGSGQNARHDFKRRMWSIAH